MTTAEDGVADGTVVTVVRVRLREAATATTTQVTIGMITKTTKPAIDTPTPIPTALETREKKSTCKRYIASQILKVQLVTLNSVTTLRLVYMYCTTASLA